MKRTLLAAVIATLAVMATGLAVRDARFISRGEAAPPHDVHFQFYERIRPTLLMGPGPVHLLCNAERTENRR